MDRQLVRYHSFLHDDPVIENKYFYLMILSNEKHTVQFISGLMYKILNGCNCTVIVDDVLYE